MLSSAASKLFRCQGFTSTGSLEHCILEKDNQQKETKGEPKANLFPVSRSSPVSQSIPSSTFCISLRRLENVILSNYFENELNCIRLANLIIGDCISQAKLQS